MCNVDCIVYCVFIIILSFLIDKDERERYVYVYIYVSNSRSPTLLTGVCIVL